MDDQGQFAGKVVLITGGSRGIGYATAAAFLSQGAKVSICSQDPARLAGAVRSLAQFGEVAGWQVNVAEREAVKEWVAQSLERFGRIDVLVNNAGRIAVGDFATQDEAVIDKIIDTNLKGTLYATRAALPHMLENGSGCVINISSSLGTYGMPQVAAYCASKFALVGFTEALADEVKAAGVRVYALTLGMSATDMQEQFSGVRQGTPPEMVADEILLLAGPKPPIEPGTCLDAYL